MGSIKKMGQGVVHNVPADLRSILVTDSVARGLWETLTPLARNEWICWVEDSRKPDTRHKRKERVLTDLKNGKRRPCCWPGCSHREKDGKKA